MLAPVVAEVRAVLGDYVYGVDVESLPAACLALLKEKSQTFATAESCTGGLLSQEITALPGSSAVYRGGVVSYWTEIKASVLGVPQDLLDQHGAVSRAHRPGHGGGGATPHRGGLRPQRHRRGGAGPRRAE